MTAYDLAVVGGGFFGVRLALLLARRGLSVILLERSERILGRASWVNQARVHNGYHYPRSLSTADGAHRHYERFLSEMASCIDDGFEHLYAIARDGSFTTAAQFERFCKELDLPLLTPPAVARRLFDPDRIEAVFVVREAAFNARVLRTKLEQALEAERRVTLATGVDVERLDLSGERAVLTTSAGPVASAAVLVVAYAEIDALLIRSGIEPLDLKAELAELCLVDPPPELAGRGITVMDGPFFSCMPMPAEGCHSFTHVRYTPHASWDLRRDLGRRPYDLLNGFTCQERFLFMQRDAMRFMPAAAGLRPRGSLFEIKAIPNRHELDDGRPIMVRRHCERPLCASVLGAKLDSVFELEAAILKLTGL